jgi:putative SOS response-associated peptidase YedK
MRLSVVTAGETGPEARTMKWGFIPGWWKEARPPRLTINARSEEAPDKPMWRAAFRGTRCLVPAVGWYEWHTESRVETATGEIHDVRQPHFVHLDGLQPLAFAGLWSSWTPEQGAEPLLTFSILTRAATASVAGLHDRMPVVLAESAYDAWLDPANADTATLRQIIANRSLADFKHDTVSTYVNNPRNQGERCIAPGAA